MPNGLSLKGGHSEDPLYESVRAWGLPFAPRIPARVVGLRAFAGPQNCSP